MSTPRWTYAGLDETSGYGIAAHRAVRALVAHGVDLAWLPFRPGVGWGLGYEPHGEVGAADVVVAHLTPEYYPLVRARVADRPVVAHTVWETDRLPRHWPELLASVDRIVVPCRWNAAVFGAAVDVPVLVVPHVAVEPVLVTHATWAGLGPDTFVAYSVAPWTARKAPWLVVEAFAQAFRGSDDAVLVLVTSPTDHTTGGRSVAALARVLARQSDPPKVVLVTRKLDDDEMAALHTRADCFVSLCRSEGWGLGAFDAGAYGNEVVITGFGGQLDYLDDRVARLVDHELVAVDDPAGAPSYTPDQTWAEPSVAHAAALLRDVVEGGERTRGERLRARIADRYDAASVAAQLVGAVEGPIG